MKAPHAGRMSPKSQPSVRAFEEDEHVAAARPRLGVAARRRRRPRPPRPAFPKGSGSPFESQNPRTPGAPPSPRRDRSRRARRARGSRRRRRRSRRPAPPPPRRRVGRADGVGAPKRAGGWRRRAGGAGSARESRLNWRGPRRSDEPATPPPRAARRARSGPPAPPAGAHGGRVDGGSAPAAGAEADRRPSAWCRVDAAHRGGRGGRGGESLPSAASRSAVARRLLDVHAPSTCSSPGRRVVEKRSCAREVLRGARARRGSRRRLAPPLDPSPRGRGVTRRWRRVLRARLLAVGYGARIRRVVLDVVACVSRARSAIAQPDCDARARGSWSESSGGVCGRARWVARRRRQSAEDAGGVAGAARAPSVGWVPRPRAVLRALLPRWESFICSKASSAPKEHLERASTARRRRRPARVASGRARSGTRVVRASEDSFRQRAKLTLEGTRAVLHRLRPRGRRRRRHRPRHGHRHATRERRPLPSWPPAPRVSAGGRAAPAF